MASKPFIVVTTPTVPGQEIAQVLGIVSGEAIGGANIFKDAAASMTDFVGGRSQGYEKTLKRIRNAALTDMVAEAREGGANAVIGVSLDFETITSNRTTMMLCVASGTAVRLG